MAFLEIQNLKKKFGSSQVLNGVSFSVEKGEVVSIIGSSGSGKTTLLRCLNLLELANDGKIFVNSQEIFDSRKKYKYNELRENRFHFGLVFQNFNLFPQYTALKNIQLALDLQSKKQIKDKKQLKLSYLQNLEIAKRLMKSVGLENKMSNYPCELSGGQCQRVAIARALALKPEILCFDEPTSALDPELTNEVLKVIRSLKSKERSMIIVTHEMQFAKEISDKVIFMADGKIEEIGSPEQIFKSPTSEKTRNFLKNMPNG